MPLLEVKDLNISFELYRGLARVVSNVDFVVEKGESVAIVGETGCGKSISVKAILGILPSPPAKIESQVINFNDQNLLEMKHDELLKLRGAGMSMVFQDPLTALNPLFTIGEQVMDIVKFHGKSDLSFLDWWFRDRFNKERQELAKKKAITALESVQMPEPEEMLKKYPFELSGGMRQRIQIAMALVTDPELVICDEPSTALDVSIQDQIINLLKESVIERGISILFITHNLGLARKLCDRIYVMYAGTIVETGKVDDIFDNPLHPYTKGLLASIPKLTGEIGDGIIGGIPDYVYPPSGCRFHTRCENARAGCQDNRPGLIEVEPSHFVSCSALDINGGV